MNMIACSAESEFEKPYYVTVCVCVCVCVCADAEVTSNGKSGKLLLFAAFVCDLW